LSISFSAWVDSIEKGGAAQEKNNNNNTIFCLTWKTRRVRIDGKNSARDRGKQVFSTYYLPPRFGVSTKKPAFRRA